MVFSILRIGVRSLCLLERNIATYPLKNSCSVLESARNIASVDASKGTFIHQNLASAQFAIREYSKHAKPHKAERKDYKSDSDYHTSSSDSDHEVLGHRGESDFWRRKMRTFHSILDVNKDGVISYDDFKLLADRFVNLGHLSEKHRNEFLMVIKDLWEKLWGEITPYNLVTVERYLEDMHHVLNDKALKKKAHAFLPFLFKAIDKSKTGKICVEDFKLFFECLGLPEQDAVFAFRIIDTNGDGRLTRKEFVSHGRLFFLTEDQECVSKYFWGPLVEH